jgi:F0F1-type ATP synthase assembly protein I
MIKENKPKKNQLNKFARFSGMAFQMGVTIVIGVIIGQYFDKIFPNDRDIYTLVFTLIFIGASLYTVIRQAIKMGNDI